MIILLIGLMFFFSFLGCVEVEIDSEIGANITLTYPNEGEFLRPNFEYEISWTSRGITNVDVELWGIKKESDSPVFVTTIAEKIDNTESYMWQVPNDFAELYNSTYKADGYVIHLSGTGVSHISDSDDDSDTALTIKNPSITFSLSDELSVLVPGFSYTLEWLAEGVDNVDIELWGKNKDSGELEFATNIAEGISSENSFKWTVPSDFADTYNVNFDEESYRLIVRDLLDTNVNDSSDRDLSILRPEIDILSFADEETDYLMPSTTKEIIWESKGVSNVDIELYGVKNGEESTTKVITIAESIVDRANYTWEVPENFDELYNSEFKDGSYRIKINDSSNDSFFGVSGRDLLIALPEIRITSTNTTLKAGDTYTVEFEYTGKNFNSKIDLYRNDEYYSTLSNDSFFNNSSKHQYSWVVPSTIDVGDSFSLRFASVDGDIAYKNKYTALSIIPVINVTSLNTDDMVWKPNNTYNITWNKTGSFSHVDISLVSDTGYTTTVVEKVSNSGSYSWKVPSDITISNSNLMVKVAEEKNYFNYINSNYISGYSDKRVSIYSLCNGLDEVIDDFGTEMLDTGREALKDITKIHLSEEEEDEEIDPNPDGPLRSSKDEDEDRKGDQEIDRDGLISRLKELHWQINEDPEGPTEYYNEETGETIIVNEDSDYDMEIVYSVDENEPSLQMLIQENPRGGADIYVYYNVWLRSKKDPDHLIHEEKMRMKYEYIIEEQDQDEVNHDIRIGTWQRTSVEMSFNYDKEYGAGERNEDDVVVWEYYDIDKNDAQTVWDFYFGKIMKSFPLSINEDGNFDFDDEIEAILETIDGKKNAYFEYTNYYDNRLKVRVYSPESREQAKELYGCDSIEENNYIVLIHYYFQGEKFRIVHFDLSKNNTGDMIVYIKDSNNDEYSIPFTHTLENCFPPLKNAQVSDIE